MASTGKPESVEAYLAEQPADVANALEELRQVIRRDVPDATEVISYGVPTFKYHGGLVAYGASKDHCSLYVMSPSLVVAMKDELAGLDVAGATIRFTPEEPLPPEVVSSVVRGRMEENEARRRAKGSP